MHASRHAIGWLLVVLLIIATGVAAHAEDKTLLRAREGAAALMRGQYDKAVAAYDEALTAPEIADFIKASIYSDRGVAKWRMNQTKDAIEDFNKSIQLSAENAIVYNNRGNALMDLGTPTRRSRISTARSPSPPAMARPTTTGATRMWHSANTMRPSRISARRLS
jgi:tetratricopeptide (TPR) repeat protein